MATLEELLNEARSSFGRLANDYPNIYNSSTGRLVRQETEFFTVNTVGLLHARCQSIMSKVAAFDALASQTTPTQTQAGEIERIRQATLRIGGYVSYKGGHRCYLDEDWHTAVDLYRQAIQYHEILGVPHRKAHYYLSYVLYILGENNTDTLSVYEETAERKWYRNKAAHYYLALHRYQVGDVDGAMRAADRGLAVEFSSADNVQAKSHARLQTLRDILVLEQSNAYNPDNYYTFRYSPVPGDAAMVVADTEFINAVRDRLNTARPADVPGTTFRHTDYRELINSYVGTTYDGPIYHGFGGGTGSVAEGFAYASAHSMNIWRTWSQAHESYLNGFFSSALESYDEVDRLLKQYWKDGRPPSNLPYFDRSLRYRSDSIHTLEELRFFDWDSIANLRTLRDHLNLFRGQTEKHLFPFFVELKLMLLHRVLLPLARAETLVAQDRFAEADGLYSALLAEPFLNKRIEAPYVRRRRAENLLARADTLYKAGAVRTTGQSEGAADKYLRVLGLYPGYVQSAYGAEAAPTPATTDVLPLQNPQVLPAAKENLLPAVRRQFGESQGELLSTLLESNMFNVGSVSLDRTPQTYPWTAAVNNPSVLRLLKLASIGLMKIRAGMNYLGYSDEYIPIWRYGYLLESARYFADRARSAERDSLNFFEKGYAEEEQARSLTQTISTQSLSLSAAESKVQQQKLRAGIAQDQVNLFDLRMDNAEANAQEAIAVGFASAFSYSASVTGGFLEGSVTVGASFSPGAIAQGFAQAAQIRRGIQEMRAEQDMARKEKVIADMETRVAEINRDIESLNLAFAQDNLNYLRSKPLNRELWFNLGRTMREISRQYLQEAITLAWLTEQAYEHEYDKRLDVIKFDYTNANTEDLLGADLLLRDLDSIEYDRLSTVQSKQVPLKFTLSLSELDPIAFQQFQRTGLMSFSTTMESLDLKFPGTYLVRVEAAEVRLQALVGRSGVVAGRLTHNGISTFRFRKGSQPITPPPDDAGAPESFSNVADDYIPGSDALGYMRRVASQPPETMPLSNFTLREDGMYFTPDVGPSGQQLRVFEDVGFAGEWTLEISPSANDFDFSTIMDAEVTFYLTAQYEERLKYLVEDYHRNLVKNAAAAGEPLSGGLPRLFTHTFPDAYYELLNPGASPQPVRVRINPSLFSHNHENVRVDKIHFYVGSEQGDLSGYQIRVEYDGQVTTGALGGPLVTAHCGPPTTVDLGGARPPFDFEVGFLDAAGVPAVVENLLDVGIVIEYRYDLRGLAPVIADFQPRQQVVGGDVTLFGRGFDHDDVHLNKVALNGVMAPVRSVNAFGTEMVIRVPDGAHSGKLGLENVWGRTVSARDLTVG